MKFFLIEFLGFLTPAQIVILWGFYTAKK